MSASIKFQQLVLRVAHLARIAEFYTNQLGFVVVQHTEREISLATAPDGEPILILQEDPAAVRPPRHSAGLFHSALLFPSRNKLGAWLRFAAQHGVDFDGFSDHAVSEAHYFSDPEGNGLEFYADRPREVWPMVGDQVQMITEPLNVESLLRSADPASAHPLSGAAWGHLHLRVTHLDRSEQFYRETLGLAVTQRDYPGARFLAADEYHHHLGLNTWGGIRQPQPEGALGLVTATFARRELPAERLVRDPDGITIRVVPL